MGSIKDYKKTIIYSIIILLLLTIMILPPLFRKTMPKKIPTPEELVIKTYLICEKETDQYKAISTMEYRDNVEYSNTIVYSRTTDKDITDEEVINEENHIFTDSDIEKMFDFFKENNFKRNSICEFILGFEK